MDSYKTPSLPVKSSSWGILKQMQRWRKEWSKLYFGTHQSNFTVGLTFDLHALCGYRKLCRRNRERKFHIPYLKDANGPVNHLFLLHFLHTDLVLKIQLSKEPDIINTLLFCSVISNSSCACLNYKFPQSLRVMIWLNVSTYMHYPTHVLVYGYNGNQDGFSQMFSSLWFLLLCVYLLSVQTFPLRRVIVMSASMNGSKWSCAAVRIGWDLTQLWRLGDGC